MDKYRWAIDVFQPNGEPLLSALVEWRRQISTSPFGDVRSMHHCPVQLFGLPLQLKGLRALLEGEAKDEFGGLGIELRGSVIIFLRSSGWEDTGEDGSDTSPIDFEMASLMKDAPVRLRIVEDAEEPSHASLSFLELPGRDHSDDFSQYLHRSCHDGSAAEDLSGSETDKNDIEHWLTITTYIHFVLPFSDEDTGDDESEEDSEEGETALQCWIGGVTEVGDGGDINDTRHKVMEALMQALDYRSLR